MRAILRLLGAWLAGTMMPLAGTAFLLGVICSMLLIGFKAGITWSKTDAF
jgi:hypothetical protein